MNKIKKTEALISKLKKIAQQSTDAHNYEKALSALSVCGNILYEYNQRYKDDDIENMLLEIGDNLISIPSDFRPKETHPVQTVLFYDGFGLDLRGLAANMTKNIAAIGYRLIYVTISRVKNFQPHIHRELEDFNVEYVYIDTDSSYVQWVEQLNQVFIEYAPQVAYFYTLPYDVSGATVFNQYKDRVIRLLVNLTDHAFWVGLNAFDYCGASRAMGAWINFHGRGIPKEKMYCNRSNIFISEKIPLGELPFDTNRFRYVFSGGSLYKTLGDSNNYFYRIIEHIVTTYPDVNFLYAGEGDGSEFEKLIKKYPGRVFLIHEREDFYQIIQGSIFFLNTYPMFGGQMMRYSVYAGKIPVTLKHNDDGEGILFYQNELGIEFDTYDEVIEEIDQILTNNEYRKQKESRLSMAVCSITKAQENLKQMIETQVSPLPVVIEEFDTGKFRQEYLERLDYDKLKEIIVEKQINRSLMSSFPKMFYKYRQKEKHQKG